MVMPQYDSYWFADDREAWAYLESRGYTVPNKDFLIHPPKPVPPYWESVLEWEAIMVLVHGWDWGYERHGPDTMNKLVDEATAKVDLAEYAKKTINPNYYKRVRFRVGDDGELEPIDE
jgi:hypothetical protein